MIPAEAAGPVIAAAAAGTIVVTGVASRRFVGARRPVASVDPRRRLSTRAIAPLAGGAGALAGVALLGPAALAVVLALAVERRRRAIAAPRARRRRAVRQLPDAMERVVLLVHAGLSPPVAVRVAARSTPAPVRSAFEAVVHRLDRGAPLADALGGLTDELGPRAEAVAHAFAAADRYGVGLEPMLDQLARDARAERRRLDEAEARRLPVRLAFPLVMCTLPSFVLVAIAPAVIAALSSLGATAW